MVLDKFKLTERPDLYWAFDGDISKKSLTDCFNELRKKIEKVLELEPGNQPLKKRLKLKGYLKKWTDDKKHLPVMKIKALSDYVSSSERE